MIRILGKKKVARRIFWVLAIVVIPSFIIWGVGTEIRGAKESLAAKVNREKITRDEYYGHLQDILKQYRQFSGGDPAEKSEEMKKIEKDVLEGLIRQEIFFQEASRRRIRVSDQEILAAIKQDPSFRDEKGRFDERRFREMVAIIPEEEWMKIEESIRQRLILRKMQNVIISEAQIKVTEEELAAYRKKFNLKQDVKDDFLRQLILAQKGNETFENWYKQVRAKAKIEIYLNDSAG